MNKTGLKVGDKAVARTNAACVGGIWTITKFYTMETAEYTHRTNCVELQSNSDDRFTAQCAVDKFYEFYTLVTKSNPEWADLWEETA